MDRGLLICKRTASQNCGTVSESFFNVKFLKCKLKLYHAKKKTYLKMIQKQPYLLQAEAQLNWIDAKWKTFQFQIFNQTFTFYRLKRRVTICLIIRSEASAFLMVCGCITAFEICSLHNWKGIISEGRSRKVLEQYVPIQVMSFSVKAFDI